MNIQDFLNRYKKKYGKALYKLAHQKECEFLICIYETPTKYLGVYTKDLTFTAKSYDINFCIEILKNKYPELKSEYGVKYFPLNKEYYDI